MNENLIDEVGALHYSCLLVSVGRFVTIAKLGRGKLTAADFTCM